MRDWGAKKSLHKNSQCGIGRSGLHLTIQLLLHVLDFYNRLTFAKRPCASKSSDSNWQRRLICMFFLRADGHRGASDDFFPSTSREWCREQNVNENNRAI